MTIDIEESCEVLSTRARQRQQRRAGGIVVGLIAVLALADLAVTAWPDDHDDVVSTAGIAPEVTWTSITLPTGVDGPSPTMAGGTRGLIAVGNVGLQREPTDPPPVPTIWHSTDAGTSWSVVYTDPTVVTDRQDFLPRPAASFESAFFVNGLFVVTGTVNLQGTNTSIAGVWTSPDGTSWTKADDTVFRSPVDATATATESRILTVGEWRNGVVAIGDLDVDAPKKRQCCGLGVGVWTSRDGTTWKRRIADLGAGFDPYIWSLTTRGAELIGGGSVDIRTGSVWATRDLRTWERSTISDHGNGDVLRIGRSYIAVGGQRTGPEPTKKQQTVDPADDTGIPTIWRSSDARSWEPVFTLPERARGTMDGLTSFSNGAAVPGLAVAVGPSARTSDTNASTLYASMNGRSWGRIQVPGESRNTRVAIVGTDASGIYVSRSARASTNQLAPAAVVWRLAPT